jgi:hypothetical protein
MIKFDILLFVLSVAMKKIEETNRLVEARDSSFPAMKILTTKMLSQRELSSLRGSNQAFLHIIRD